MQHDRSGAGAAQVLGVQVLPRITALSLPLALGLASLLAASEPSRAQDASPASLREMVKSRRQEMAGASITDLARALPPSLATVLGLDARQVERLDGLWGDFVLARLEQEGKIARWQDALKIAQSPTWFDEGRARGLLKNIAEAQDKTRAAFLKARGSALRALTPTQRARVQALAQSAPAPESPTPPASTLDEPNGAPAVREDAYRQLLLMPVERLLQTPPDTAAARRVLAERARGRYDRYGIGSSRYGYSSGRYGGAFGGFGGFGWGRGFEFGGIYGHFGHRHGSGHPQHGGAPH